jgi:excinuclease UvrABC helicase subunit UvrB
MTETIIIVLSIIVVILVIREYLYRKIVKRIIKENSILTEELKKTNIEFSKECMQHANDMMMAESVFRTIEDTLKQNGIQIKMLNSPFTSKEPKIQTITNPDIISQFLGEEIKSEENKSVEFLQTELQKAIDAEDFEKAAKLRDDISNFKKSI